MNFQRKILTIAVLAVILVAVGFTLLGRDRVETYVEKAVPSSALRSLGGGSTADSVISLGEKICEASEIDRALWDASIKKGMEVHGHAWGIPQCAGSASADELAETDAVVESAVAEEELKQEIEDAIRQEQATAEAAETAAAGVEVEAEKSE